MKLNKKKKLNVVNFGGGSLLLASLALSAAGFSSWVVVNNISASANISAAEININSKDIFTYVGKTSFVLGQDGIINEENETIDEIGYFTVTFKINNQVCADNGFVSSYRDETSSIEYQNAFQGYAYLIDGGNTSGITSYVTDCSISSIDNGTNQSISKQESEEGKVAYSFLFDMDLDKEYTNMSLRYKFEGDLSPFYATKLTLTFKLEAHKA